MKLFSKEVVTESSSGDSSQARVYFGREATLGIRVVVKQYTHLALNSFMQEVKIFAKLDDLNHNQNNG